MTTTVGYRIVATINAPDKAAIGMNAADWFEDGARLLAAHFDTPDSAARAADTYYTGPNENGIEVTWEITDE